MKQVSTRERGDIDEKKTSKEANKKTKKNKK